jgi:hypothetical protein
MLIATFARQYACGFDRLAIRREDPEVEARFMGLVSRVNMETGTEGDDRKKDGGK